MIAKRPQKARNFRRFDRLLISNKFRNNIGMALRHHSLLDGGVIQLGLRDYFVAPIECKVARSDDATESAESENE